MAQMIVTESATRSPGISYLGSNCAVCTTRRVCEAKSLLNELPDNIQMQLFQPRIIKTGKHLFHAGDELTTFYIIKSGAFKTYLYSESGDEFITGFHMPGEVLGADGLGDHKHQLTAIALDSSAVCAISIKKLESEVKRYSSNWLMKQACLGGHRENQTFFVSIRNNTSAYARIAYFLLKQSHDHKVRGYSGKEFKLDMKRNDIANYLGLTIETVSRTLHCLQEDKMINVNGRYIGINDMHGLRATAGMRSAPERLSA